MSTNNMSNWRCSYLDDYLKLQNEGMYGSYFNVKMMNKEGQQLFGYIGYSEPVMWYHGLKLKSVSPAPEEKRHLDARSLIWLLFELHGKMVPVDSLLIPKVSGLVDFRDIEFLVELLFEKSEKLNEFRNGICAKVTQLLTLEERNPALTSVKRAEMDNGNPCDNIKLRIQLMLHGIVDTPFNVTLGGVISPENGDVLLPVPVDFHNHWNDEEPIDFDEEKDDGEGAADDGRM